MAPTSISPSSQPTTTTPCGDDRQMLRHVHPLVASLQQKQPIALSTPKRRRCCAWFTWASFFPAKVGGKLLLPWWKSRRRRGVHVDVKAWNGRAIRLGYARKAQVEQPGENNGGGGGGQAGDPDPRVPCVIIARRHAPEGYVLACELHRRLRLDRKLGLQPILVPPARPLSPALGPPQRPLQPSSTEIGSKEIVQGDRDRDSPETDSTRLRYLRPANRHDRSLLREVEALVDMVKQASMETQSLDTKQFEAVVDLRAEVVAWEMAVLDDTLVEWDAGGRFVKFADAEKVRMILDKWRERLDTIFRSG
ncbi:hypothetical protein FN846DRAFT_997627 [Sphaerosporella brunnea]|uniref:Uncharacterized protein n=1 Tax=Sphaerosporella brunnea TaxID=1250544 RepID=A0A5J5EJN2_9PEZI|nr:hypothetical protein FN846DRAFT_997627 [Sphaerosporella brunnea]